MTTTDLIITPDVEALLQRYIDATAELLERAGEPISHVALGTNLHLQLEVIITLEHAAKLLAEKIEHTAKLLAEKIAKHEGDGALRMRELALLSVRHSILIGIIRVLKERTAQITVASSRTGPSPMFCDATCLVSAVDGRTALHSGRGLWRVVCPVHGLIHPGTTSGEHWVKAHQERGEVWPGQDDQVPPGTDIPVPAGHPGIVITPMGKKDGG